MMNLKHQLTTLAVAALIASVLEAAEAQNLPTVILSEGKKERGVVAIDPETTQALAMTLPRQPGIS